MTYASIEEAWGGVSGNSMLSQRIHPIHMQHLQNNQEVETFMSQPPPNQRDTQRYAQNNNQPEELYQCNYGTHESCNQAFKMNQKYNEQKKQVAQGLQPFMPDSPNPKNYTFAPQYPWYPAAKSGYLMYPQMVSNMWYNNPYQFDPEVATQIAQAQMAQAQMAQAQTEHYTPPMPPPMPPPMMYPLQQIMYPQMMPPQMIPQMVMPQMAPQMVPQMVMPQMVQPQMMIYPRITPPSNLTTSSKKKEHFGDVQPSEMSETCKQGLIYLAFFIIAIAVVLIMMYICITCTKK